MIYGYGKKVENSSMLLMKEVTIDMPPEHLRRIANFISKAADDLELNHKLKSSHVHIGELISDWHAFYPDLEIIIISPLGSTESKIVQE
jgi:hypothetical protein